MNWIIREQQREESTYNAGSKARSDVDSILVSVGYKPLVANLEIDTSQGVLRKIFLQFKRYFEWNKIIKSLSPQDIVFIQYPVRNHTILFGGFLKKLRNYGVKVVGIVHDLEALRQAVDNNIPTISKIRFRLEEVSALKYFSKVIVHNEYMRKVIYELFGLPMDRMISLGIFDYLYEPKEHLSVATKDGPVIIAGSLDRNKAGYVYDLPEGIRFDLYGANIDANFCFKKNVVYRGKVRPDVLPSVLKGSFGLVWDGPSPKTCMGVFGEYLKVNNPHKTSLYLAAGLPVIVWKESAIADFVLKNKCGIVIDSLEELNTKINTINEAQYNRLLLGVQQVNSLIKKGGYLKNAVKLIS